MEIKVTLQKPYEEKDRLAFIVEKNHVHGYEIKDTETALEAWGYTDEEIAEQEKQAHKADLVAQLDALDLKTIRALRAIQAGTGTDADVQRLAELEAQAAEIRQQLQEL